MTAPSVLLIDDGELDDVRTLLAQLGAEFVHLRGGAIPAELDPPRDLFVSTTRRALVAERWDRPAGGSGPLRVAVVTEDSNTLRNRLRRAGFDLLIRRPVHPYALRLVLLKGLYSGSERRGDTRVPIGHPVRYRTGLRSRRAWIADLSLSGGRLLVNERLAAGTRISVQLPSAVTDGRSLSLRGRVLRSGPAGQNSGGAAFASAVRFEKLSMDARRRIFQILNDRAHGPARLPDTIALDTEPPPLQEPDAAAATVPDAAAATVPDAAAATAPDAAAATVPDTAAATAPDAAAASVPAAAPGSPEDRRKHERVSYEREVAILGEARCVVMGRDLSMGGMRIEPHPELSVGDRLELAIYAEAEGNPAVVKAEVIRAEDGVGLGLRFLDLDPGVATRLERLVTQLPAVEPLADGECEAMGAVVGRILSSDGES